MLFVDFFNWMLETLFEFIDGKNLIGKFSMNEYDVERVCIQMKEMLIY